MDKKGMLETLIKHYCNGNKAQFAGILGIKPQTINSWLVRDTFDAELIFAKCLYVSGDWLLSGKGEMLKNSQNSAGAVPSQTETSIFIEKIAEQATEIGRLNERIKRLELEKERLASAVQTSSAANVG